MILASRPGAHLASVACACPDACIDREAGALGLGLAGTPASAGMRVLVVAVVVMAIGPSLSLEMLLLDWNGRRA